MDQSLRGRIVVLQLALDEDEIRMMIWQVVVIRGSPYRQWWRGSGRHHVEQVRGEKMKTKTSSPAVKIRSGTFGRLGLLGRAGGLRSSGQVPLFYCLPFSIICFKFY
jgi:hypothetical protein